jgi:hypothetical protein
MTLRISVLLSVQRALLGAVPSSLRAVACDWTNDLIVLRFIFDGPIDEQDAESMNAVCTEVMADFPSPTGIKEEMIRADYPIEVSRYALKDWAYMRKEPPQAQGRAQ